MSPVNAFSWLSMMWKSSCGGGMRPVSSFDQIGMSFKKISKAPDDTNYTFCMETKKKQNFNLILKKYDFSTDLGVGDKNNVCRINYLSFEHISDKEYHHTGINLIFYTPRKPSWYSLSNLSPNIILWHND